MADGPDRPTALFVSPHLDDVAFSCGGALALLAREGWRTVLATVFTRSVPDPTGFALACQTDKGLPPEVDYMALRREEDREAARRLGAGSTSGWISPRPLTAGTAPPPRCSPGFPKGTTRGGTSPGSSRA
ncbi:PIG-L deacetylase family protein [Rubrobacter marinus]|uniref:PIG-L deacetylase family protein n=1 Tax=Rubrobacter marinus TaxID=2653852 RepID=UPI001A9F9112|nr:PIG-L family deacetylase [Rubrobacter marinus]